MGRGVPATGRPSVLALLTGTPPVSAARRSTRSGSRRVRHPGPGAVRLHFPRHGLHADEWCVTELADDAPFAIDRLLEWAARDERSGVAAPGEPD